MNAVLRSELLKLRTTKSAFGVAFGLLALVVFVVMLHALVLGFDPPTAADEMHVFGWGELGALFAGLLGALSITGELRHGTIRPTFLATPTRAKVLIAKAVVVVLAGIGFGVVAEGLALGLGAAVLGLRGVPILLDSGDYTQLMIGGIVAAALFGPVGLGLGAILRNQVTTLVGLFAWVLFLENVLLGQLPGAARYLPGTAAAAIAGSTLTGELPRSPGLLAPVVGALVLVGYAAVAMLVGIALTERRDVS